MSHHRLFSEVPTHLRSDNSKKKSDNSKKQNLLCNEQGPLSLLSLFGELCVMVKVTCSGVGWPRFKTLQVIIIGKLLDLCSFVSSDEKNGRDS